MTRSYTIEDVEILPYSEDATMERALREQGDSFLCRVWEQPEFCIVMGKSGQLPKEIHIPNVVEDNVSVYRREGGGGTVVLAPGMLIISVAAHMRDPFSNMRYFKLIQQPIAECLQERGVANVSQRGISDLAVDGRKILGSSMRRRGTFLLYQAVLLVRAERELFATYLPHPPKEPDYREGRGHGDFTVSLEELGLQDTPTELAEHLQASIPSRMAGLLEDDLCEPEQIKWLK